MLEVGCLASLAWVYPEVATLRLRAPDRQGEEGEDQQPGHWRHVGDGDRQSRQTDPTLPDTQRHCYLCTLIRKDYAVI